MLDSLSAPRHLRPWTVSLASALCATLLIACGGGGSSPVATENGLAVPQPVASAPAVASDVPAAASAASAPAPAPAPMSQRDAVRLAHQATFGPTETLVADIRSQGLENWLADQMQRQDSRYRSGGGADVHQLTEATTYCAQAAHAHPDCWRNNFSTQPLAWDFYRNATTQADQLRQRVAFALGQVLVVSNVQVEGTYGFRVYHNMLLDLALGNYRDLLRGVIRSPLMGDYLNHVNNNPSAPNENFARELLELFSLGTCQLQPDGERVGTNCKPLYDNATVREYALALTGWTYPSGGKSAWGCWPEGANCRFHDSPMVALPALHASGARRLLSGVNLAAGHDAPTALEAVLDSVMRHPNLGPFLAQRLIRALVRSNPSPTYVARVSAAFDAGRHCGLQRCFGAAQRGDLAATVAAVLMDEEARSGTGDRRGGKLREPVLLFTGLLRAVGGHTDGDALGWWWGGELRQVVFRAPSVFNFYRPSHPVPGTTLVGPEFGLHGANAALRRLNFMSFLLDLQGAAPDAGVPQAIGTQLDLSTWAARADDAAALVDQFSLLVLGQPLPDPGRSAVVQAATWWDASRSPDWREQRARTTAYLVMASPQYQVQP